MNKTVILGLFFHFLTLIYSTSLFSECLHLKDDSVIIGTIIKNTTDTSSDTVTIQTEYGLLHIDKSRINNGYKNYTEYKDHVNDKRWKRHFFDFSLTTGGTLSYDNMEKYFNGYGGIIGTGIGYMFAVNKYFAFGLGGYGFVSLSYSNCNYEGNSGCYEGHNMWFSAGAVLLQYMIGDLRDKKIAFLIDIGGAWGFALKVGLYAKGFIIKVGYHNFFMINYLTLDVGYKLSWKRKVKFVNF